MVRKYLIVLAAAFFVAVTGCSSKLGNMAVGAGAAGAAYEYSNKRQMEELEKEYADGKISKEEYDRRRKEIEGRSVVQ